MCAMSDVIVVGTDTGAGKTTLALLWMASFGKDYDYWKPVETGESDSELVTRLVPTARVHPPLARYHEAVAPALAARRAGIRPPTVADIVSARPTADDTNPKRERGRESFDGTRHLLIETFGSPMSPLNNHELQVRLLAALSLPLVLVTSSAVGAIGRTLQSVASLRASNLRPVAVALIGTRDDYAVEQIKLHGQIKNVFSFNVPTTFTAANIARSASEQSASLAALRRVTDASVGERASAAEIVDRDRTAIWHPYTSLGDPDPPLVAVEARDEFITLSDGRRVIDGISSWWTILHGHRHPVLMQALADAACRYDHVHFAGVTHAPAVELAELMLSTMPWQGGRAFFSDDGSTAVEVALKMAYQYWCHHGAPHRTCFVGFDGGYHGDTFGAMAVGRDPVFFGRFEPLLFHAERLPVSADRLDDFLLQTREQVAAIIIEPLVQGAGGMRMHTPEQLRAIYEVTCKHDVLFIADEVMTGGGRTGELWAHRAARIEPDLVCAGKTIAGGVLPLAATLVAPRVVAAWNTTERSRTFFHGHSFTAHPLACSVGAANWRMLASRVSPPAEMEKFWTERLSSLLETPGIKDVRIRGTIAAVELDTSGGYLSEIGGRLRRACIERGVLLRPLGNVLYAMPPFCTSRRSLEQIADAIECAVKELL
jgi:adenosylmethionine-8-amino-7-oxononanoate aminotransferase